MKELKFTKMHWIWNDFIVIEDLYLKENNIILDEKLIQKLCDRHFWIWSDWVIIIEKWIKTKFKYRMFNPDWTEAEMCGNWIRCYMKYLLNNNLYDKKEINIETWAWILNLTIDDNVVTVDMWKPKKIKWLGCENLRLWDKFFIKVDYKNFAFIPISMWNPHAVIFTKYSNDEHFDIIKYWKAIEENTDIFPQKTNVEFVDVISDVEISMRVWERWAWETLACWTWACASVVAWILDWSLEKNKFVKVNLIWWILEVMWSWNENDHVIMKWVAETVFKWVYFIK